MTQWDELLAVDRERVWHRAADALARGAILDAAEILASAGAETYAAHFRLRGAQTLVAADRTDEAGVQRERALEFYRRLGARPVRGWIPQQLRGEALAALAEGTKDG